MLSMRWLPLLTIALGIPATMPSFAAAAAREPQGGTIKVEVQGTLRHGLVAIGGETTGTVISASGATWELDLGDNAEWRKLAESLDGKQAVVTGTLEVRPGVEIPKRWIVTVESLQAAP